LSPVMPPTAAPLFGHAPHRPPAETAADHFPMTRAEMDALGWDSCDVIIVTGDAYVDLPSFGMAVMGRVLQKAGFRVGIISQPDWQSVDDFRRLGPPNLFFGVTAGNMDSMVNHYTSERKIRSNDSYTPGGLAGKRPDRAVLVYAQRSREAFKGVPVIIGGIEASLRRIAQYDYWSDKVRRSVLPDSKADLLIFGNGERQILDLAHRLAAGEAIGTITDLRGTAYMRRGLPEGFTELDASNLEQSLQPFADRDHSVVRLPAYEEVVKDEILYAHASRTMHLETNPGNARAMVQCHGDRDVWLNPPPVPLTSEEMDAVFDLPYTRVPHPSYGRQKIPAYDMIKNSINIMRGCFGGCTFCSITEHEGRIIQNRSEESILREIENIRDKTPGFTGVISDLGGPTANMWRLACKSPEIEASCRKPSCVFPDICPNLNTDHNPLIQLYRKAREVPGIKRVFVASGVRYDLAVESPEYVAELAKHHVGGYLKIAPEHTEDRPLNMMMKPGIGSYERFKRMFEKASRAAGKKQYLIPYFIAAHPGTSDGDMLNLALWLKKNRFKPDQVQTFLPSPMATATAMYHSGRNPLRKIMRQARPEGDKVFSAKKKKQRDLHKAFLRYHDKKNWPMLRQALKNLGREDLVGSGPDCLVPGVGPGGQDMHAAGQSKTAARSRIGKGPKSGKKTPRYAAKKKSGRKKR